MNDRNLDLNALASFHFWSDYTDEQEKMLRLAVILPSGRSAFSTCGHLALISDALYTYEIVNKIQQIVTIPEKCQLKLRGMLDIDYFESLKKYELQGEENLSSEEKDLILKNNLFLLATGDINIVTRKLLEDVKSYNLYSTGFAEPYDDCIIVGRSRERYRVTAYPYVGVLMLHNIPWNNRLCIISGGIIAPGTLAANLLLLQYLQGNKQGNNIHDPKVPVKIVSAYCRNYAYVPLLSVDKCNPGHDLRNIEEAIKIHE